MKNQQRYKFNAIKRAYNWLTYKAETSKSHIENKQRVDSYADSVFDNSTAAKNANTCSQ